jgi:hypothetical protein
VAGRPQRQTDGWAVHGDAFQDVEGIGQGAGGWDAAGVAGVAGGELGTQGGLPAAQHPG